MVQSLKLSGKLLNKIFPNYTTNVKLLRANIVVCRWRCSFLKILLKIKLIDVNNDQYYLIPIFNIQSQFQIFTHNHRLYSITFPVGLVVIQVKRGFNFKS